jgi:hypothetical protein
MFPASGPTKSSGSRAKVSLVRLVEGAGVEFKRMGKDLHGRCPFHDDKTPSLVVSPEKNLWHSLHARGDPRPERRAPGHAPANASTKRAPVAQTPEVKAFLEQPQHEADEDLDDARGQRLH